MENAHDMRFIFYHKRNIDEGRDSVYTFVNMLEQAQIDVVDRAVLKHSYEEEDFVDEEMLHLILETLDIHIPIQYTPRCRRTMNAEAYGPTEPGILIDELFEYTIISFLFTMYSLAYDQSEENTIRCMKNFYVIEDPHYGSFLLVDVQFVQFMLALVDTPTPYKVIAIRRISALEVTFFYKLAQTGAGTDGSLFAFSVRLPESDVVQQFVSVVVETLLTLLGTPYPDAVPYKPFHNKGRFICDTTDTVEHEYQQDIELALSGIVLDDLELVAGGGPDFVAGHAFFLFFMDDDPALRFSEFMASLSLHGQVCFMVGVEIHLLIGGNAVQAAHAIVISCHCKFLTFIIKVGIGFISLSKNVRQWLGL